MERKTEQRDAIRKAFLETKRPLSVQEIFSITKKQIPKMGIATIYRNLKILIKNGWLVLVELPGESGRYEMANLDHHHHFCCTKCNRIFDISDCPKNIEDLVPEGFSLDRHDITLYGLCEECNKNK